MKRLGRIWSLLILRPANGWLAVRMAAWSVAIPYLKYLLPLPRLVRLMAPRPSGRERQPSREPLIVALSRALIRPGVDPNHGRCLERSLLVYRYLARANAAPQLVVGMHRADQAYQGHVWVTVDGQPVDDSPEKLDRFAPILVFDHEGRTESTPGAGSLFNNRLLTEARPLLP